MAFSARSETREHLRCALVFGRVRVGYTVRHCRVRVVCGLENLWSY